jgi:hypothetical protein
MYLPGANQIDLFMHFLGASRDGLDARRVDLDTISSSEINPAGLQEFHCKTTPVWVGKWFVGAVLMA